MEMGITEEARKAFNLVWAKDANRETAKEVALGWYRDYFMSGGEGGDVEYAKSTIDGIIDAHTADKSGDPCIEDINLFFASEEEKHGKVSHARG